MTLKVGDKVTVYHLWNRDNSLKPATVFKIFSGNQCIVITESGRRYKTTTGQCSSPLTEAEYFKFILKNGT